MDCATALTTALQEFALSIAASVTTGVIACRLSENKKKAIITILK